MSKKCKSCQKLGKDKRPTKSITDENSIACESYKRKGYRTAAVTAITTNCADTSCRFWTDDLDQHPDNCLKGVNDRKKPGKDCKFWEFKPGVSDSSRCDKKDCLHYGKASKTNDNCSNGAFGLDKCEYLPRKSTRMKSAINTFESPKNPNPYCKTIPQSISQGASPETDPFVVDAINGEIFTEPLMSLSDLCKACKEYDCEIIIRPIKK
jgi:hypothetical protein